jgi:O-antigen/teichoic acid export membrane protein
MPAETVIRAFGRTITVVAVAIAVYSGRGLLEVAWAILLASLVEVTTYGFLAQRRFGLHRVNLNWGIVKKTVLASSPLAINTMLVVAYFRLSMVVLTTLKGAQAAGWFAAAFAFIQLLQLVSGSVAAVALPIMSRQQRQSHDQLLASLNKATYYLLLLVGPVSLVICFMAKHLVLFVYGTQFMPAVESLRLLIWASVFMFMGSIYGAALISLDKEQGLIAIGVIALVVNMTTNFLAIPRWSYMGATLATLITEASVAALAYAFVSRALKGFSISSLMVKPVSVTLVLAVAMLMMRSCPWVLQAFLATLVYVLTVILIRAVQREDWQMLSAFTAARSVQDVI